MDNKRIGEIIQELDDMLSGERPSSQITMEEPNYLLSLTATQSGLVSLAREFLTASISDPVSNSTFYLDGSHQQLSQSNEDLILGPIWCEKELPVSEYELANRSKKRGVRDFVALIGCGIFGFVFLFILFGGCIFWFNTLFNEI